MNIFNRNDVYIEYYCTIANVPLCALGIHMQLTSRLSTNSQNCWWDMQCWKNEGKNIPTSVSVLAG